MHRKKKVSRFGPHFFPYDVGHLEVDVKSHKLLLPRDNIFFDESFYSFNSLALHPYNKKKIKIAVYEDGICTKQREFHRHIFYIQICSKISSLFVSQFTIML